jgi:hypothetical protein
MQRFFPPSLYFVHFLNKQMFSVTLCIADIEHVLQFVMLYLLTMSHNLMCTAQTEIVMVLNGKWLGSDMYSNLHDSDENL